MEKIIMKCHFFYKTDGVKYILFLSFLLHILSCTNATPNFKSLNISSLGVSGEAKVEMVTTDHPDGDFRVGEVIYIKVKFTNTINFEKGDGNLVLSLNTLPTPEISGQGILDEVSSNFITFKYIVQSSDNSNRLNYLSQNALILSGGAKLVDDSNNDVNLSLPTLCLTTIGSCSNILNGGTLNPTLIKIDNIGPKYKVLNVTHNNLWNSLTSSPILTFSPNSNDLDVERYIVQIFYYSTSNLSNPIATNNDFISGGQFNGLNGISDGGSYVFVITPVDRAGNLSSNPTKSSSPWVVDVSAPIATITGAPAQNSSSNVAALNVTIGGSNVVSYKYKVGYSNPGYCDDTSNYSSTLSIGNPITKDLSNYPNGSSLTLCVVGKDSANNQQPYGSATYVTWIKDTSTPTIVSVSTDRASGFYSVGEIIDVKVTFSEPIIVVGAPYMTLNKNSENSIVNFYSVSNSKTLIFRYMVESGDATPKLNYININSLVLGGGASIYDSAGNQADLELPSLNSSSNELSLKTIHIDTINPSLTGSFSVGGGGWTNSTEHTPSFSFSSGTDLESGINFYEIKVVRVTAPETVIVDYRPKMSGAVFSVSQDGMPLLVNGNIYKFYIRAVDRAGNRSNTIGSGDWSVDTSPPTLPGDITIGAVPNMYTQQTPRFTLNGSTDEYSGISYYQIQVLNSSQNIVQDYVSAGSDLNSGLNITWQSSQLIAGDHYYVKIRAVDRAGNIGLPAQSNYWIALLCPGAGGAQGYFTLIPAKFPYTNKAFCVSQFEMKYNSSTDKAYSTPLETPWVNINRNDAISKCQNLGFNYHLINNRQWQTIAQNAELNPINWTSGTVGSGMVFRGHSDVASGNDKFKGTFELPVEDVSDFYNATGNSGADLIGYGLEQKRVLLISSYNFPDGINLWDFSGNVSEWIREDYDNSLSFYNYISELTDTGSFSWDGIVGSLRSLLGPHGVYSSESLFQYGGLGFGSLVIDSQSINRGVIRSGDWDDFDRAGIFNASLDVDENAAHPNIGFRCVYTP